MNLLTPEQAFNLMMAGKNIECRNPSFVPAINEFSPVEEFSANVYALPGFEFRQAATMMRIGNHLYPEAEITEPAEGTVYFIPSLTRGDFFSALTWRGDDSQKEALRRKMVHLSQQAAIDHAKAIILSGGGSFPQRVSIAFNNVLPAVQEMFEQDAAKAKSSAMNQTDPALENMNGLLESEN